MKGWVQGRELFCGDEPLQFQISHNLEISSLVCVRVTLAQHISPLVDHQFLREVIETKVRMCGSVSGREEVRGEL